jgi:outer membrane lipoprotein-sorting protein
MFRYCLMIVSVAGMIAFIDAGIAAQALTDPYEILNRHFKAMGGLERLMTERTSYSEGTISLGGMQGIVKIWAQKPGKSRIETSLGPLNIIQGDNGKNAWVQDQNGKVQVTTHPDEATEKRRQVRKLIDEYAYADRGSSVFTVSLQGIELVEAESCYVIKVANKINSDSHTYYIDIHTFYPIMERIIEDIESRDIFYADYRQVDGLLIPFMVREIRHQTGQSQEIRLTDYKSNPETDPSVFEPPSQGSKDYQFENGDRAENVPFRFIGDHIYIPVNTDGKERLWILDTGASMSVLNKAFADELGLAVEGQLAGMDASGVVDVGFTTLPPYSVAGIQFKKQTVGVIDMSELIRRLGPDVAGILGFDFLSRFVTKVDFADELLSFYDPETFEYAGNGHVVDMHVRNGVFTTEATLDGRYPGIWLFDLGAGSTQLDGRFALREGFAGRMGVLREGHGAGNEYQLKSIKADSIQFAGFTIYRPEINFPYGGTDTAFAADQTGILGNSLFRHFVLYCDYSGERLILEKGERFNKDWPEDNSGLQIAWSRDHKVEVWYVSPGTPAEKAGFRQGDLLRSVNGIDVNLLDGIVAIREMLKGSPGTTFEFVSDRAGKDMNLRLKLARLY